MKSLKKLMVAILTVAVLCTSVVGTALAASPSVEPIAIKKVSLKKSTVNYSSKGSTASVTVTGDDGRTLKLNEDFVITPKSLKFTNSGTYTITIKGIGAYKGTKTVKFTVKGSKTNKISAKAAKTSVKKSSLKKKSTKIKINVKQSKNVKGKVTYSVVKGSSKYITVSSKGTVTLKKGAKAGTYKVKVSVAGYKSYKPTSKTITIKVK